MRELKSIKSVFSLFSILLIIFISSCKQVMFNKIELSKQEHIWGDEIVKCIKENDKKNLNNLFCDKVKNTDYLDKEIDFF